MMKLMQIGEVAKRAEVGIETIRYYEREGLLSEPERRPSGYRQYDESVVPRLQFIRRSKELGFTLREIGELLGLWFDNKTKCVHVRQRAEQKIQDIEAKIASLQKMKRSLRKLIRTCENRNSMEACPLLDGLDGETRSTGGP
jgi:MerR family transcriptional regulator, copper efflux regulator